MSERQPGKLEFLTLLRGAELPHAAFRVLVVLVTFTDGSMNNAYPSMATLGEAAQVSEKTLKGALRLLRDGGWISLQQEGGNQHGKGRANMWRVRSPEPKGGNEEPPSDSTKGGNSDTPSDPEPPRGKGGNDSRQGGYSLPGRGVVVPEQGGYSLPPHQVLDHVIDQVLDQELQKTPSPRAAKPSEPSRFAEFWQTYPRRQGKGAAIKAYEKALRRADAEEILAAAYRYAADPNREDQFTAHPTTWLNQDRWLDDALPSKAPQRNAPMSASEKVAGWGDVARQFVEAQEPHWAIEAGA